MLSNRQLVNFLENFFQEYYLSNRLDPDQVRLLIWVQTVCKSFQWMTLVGNELSQKKIEINFHTDQKI